MSYIIEIRGVSTWAGQSVNRHQWIPAIAGTLNQTKHDDETASTFDTREAADAAHLMVWDMLSKEAGESSPASGIHLRVIEVG